MTPEEQKRMDSVIAEMTRWFDHACIAFQLSPEQIYRLRDIAARRTDPEAKGSRCFSGEQDFMWFVYQWRMGL